MASLPAVAGAVSLCTTVWRSMCNPLANIYRDLRDLRSTADELSASAGRLTELEKDVTARIQELVSDQSRERSNQASHWFSSVRALVDSERDFRSKFDHRRSSYDCFRCGWYKNYKLAEKAKDLLKKAEELTTQRNGFTDDQLVNRVRDMVIALRTLPATVSSLSKEKKTAGNLMADLKAIVDDSVLESKETMECSKRGREWFEKTESSSASCRVIFERNATVGGTQCGNTPSSSCSSMEEACDACKDKYTLGQDAGKLLKQIQSLTEEGRGLTKEQLISPVAVLVKLEANVRSLSRVSQMLAGLREDTEKKVRHLVCRDQRMERSNEAKDWFRDTQSIIESAMEASEKYEAAGSSCTGNHNAPPFSSGFSKDCDSCSRRGYELGEEVIRLLEEAKRLEQRGRSFSEDQLVVIGLPSAVVEIPNDLVAVGQEKKLNDTLELINDDGVVMVGITGMGGVGKTTLLEAVNNHLWSNGGGGFDVVIYTKAGREKEAKDAILTMQRQIGKRLGLSFPESGGLVTEQASWIRQNLRSKKFLLLLDDLWETIDLVESLGLPPFNTDPQNKSKVVITTRDEIVYRNMRITKKRLVQMEMLSPEQSWELFCNNVRNRVVLSDAKIEPIARDVARQCGGLPLALVTVGTAMSGATNVSEWRNARSELKDSPHAVQGMEKKVLSQLKFSFDRLGDDMRDILFLCLALVGNTRCIKVGDLVTYIVTEGILGHVARDKAKSVILSLLKSGLLAYCRSCSSSVVLHDSVHDMLLWLDSDEGKNQKMVKWIPPSGEDLPLFLKKWEHAKRITMDYSSLEEIADDAEIPQCNHLHNLLWRHAKIVRLPENFFSFMPSLGVLDLQGSNIQAIPGSIGDLSNLNLLHLCWTAVEKLPPELGKLKKLTNLCLYSTSKLIDFPRKCISTLLRLKYFTTTFSSFPWAWESRGECGQVALDDLRKLAEKGVLSFIRLSLKDYDGAIVADHLAGSMKFLMSIVGLGLDNCVNGADMMDRQLEIVAKMERLKSLFLQNLDLSKWRFSSFSLSDVLRFLTIENCRGISNLEWTIRIPSLHELQVTSCEELGILSPDGPLPDLNVLEITNCQKLHTIAGIFSSLEILIVKDCPELKNLQFDEHTAAKIKTIEGSQEWWNGLEWASEEVRSRLLHCYTPLAIASTS